MKTPADVLTDIRRRLDRTWAADLAGASTSWPHRFPIGTPRKSELEAGWARTYQPLIRQWRDWAKMQPVQLHTEPKRVYTTTQDIPVHVEVAGLDAAARVVGDDWTFRLARTRDRLGLLVQRFPGTPELDRVVRATDKYSDTDFDLLLTTAAWFQANDATGLTPRQVPIPGVHAKWLNTRQSLIIALSGRANLGLLPRHPARIHFTYLDPAYRATGARHHDSATVGDAFTPPYRPAVVIISENKDTAVHFPPVDGGVAVEGDGFGGKTAAAFPWLTQAPHLYYWGDIDTHGYEILNGWREDGVAVRSILMDPATHETFEPYGTNTDRNGILLQPGTPKPLPRLTPTERAVYERLLAPAWRGHRRVEQERIPLRFAAETLTAHLS
ncbi:Wadjet anti-phage system protein JetD domain-containing protein [Actinosynnema sp. NPDC059335]|uniref:Wadjet anti-phage system protein JetD domain-containing protein n=1 Tax=Actinosynnema sp. NPDC059335 TaxID=3346804 RepID=UPI00366F48FD